MSRNVVMVAAVSLVILSLLAGSQAFAAQAVRTDPGTGPALEEEATATPTAEAEDPQPVVEALAAYFGVTEEEIQALFDSGVGFGVITQAYVLSDILGKTPQEIIDMKETGDENWGQMLKEAGVKPGKGRVKLGTIMSEADETEVTPEATANGLGHKQDESEDQSQNEQQTGRGKSSENDGGNGNHGEGKGGGKNK